MSKAYTGGCACGAIRYEISAEPLVMSDCQCRDCQRKSGTGHGSYLTFTGRRSVKLEGDAGTGTSPATAATSRRAPSARPAGRPFT